MITRERLIWLETNEREGLKIGNLPVILSKDFLELIALSRFALDAKEALVWENTHRGTLSNQLGEVLASFPSEDE